MMEVLPNAPPIVSFNSDSLFMHSKESLCKKFFRERERVSPYKKNPLSLSQPIATPSSAEAPSPPADIDPTPIRIHFPVTHDGICVIPSLLDSSGFESRVPVHYGDTFYDTPDLALQSNNGGMWLRLRQNVDDESYEWNLRICSNYRESGFLRYRDITKHNDILSTIWPICCPGQELPRDISDQEDGNEFDPFSFLIAKTLRPMTVFSFKRLNFVRSGDDIQVSIDMVQLAKDTYVVMGTASGMDFNNLFDFFHKDLTKCHDMLTHQTRSKIAEVMFHSRRSLYNILQQAEIFSGESRFQGHITKELPVNLTFNDIR
eukprot:TRINITY_DN9841_c0_g1_i3.p1 TRINITY_DN9841_c0_g1~~TRINITY_DN9841_c0_g1_i3.p1  ORF type:complete len:317 (-),score=44.38 TRINITY_DN9841_c0_g1_i3:205-1155(-)